MDIKTLIWNNQNNIDMMWSLIRTAAPEQIGRIDFENPTPDDIDNLISLFDFLERNIPPISATQELSDCITDLLVKLEENIRYSEAEYNPNRVLCAYMLQGILYLLGYNHTILGDYFDIKTHAQIHLEPFFLDEDTKEANIDFEEVNNYSRFLNVAYRYTLTIPELTDVPILAHYAIEQLIEGEIERLEIKLANPDVYYGQASEMNQFQIQAQIDNLKSLLFLVTSPKGLARIPVTAAASLPKIKDVNTIVDTEETENIEDGEYVAPDDNEIFICLEAYALLEQDALEFVKRHVSDKNIEILMKFFEYIVDQVFFSVEAQDAKELENIFRSALNLLISSDPKLALKVIPGPRERISNEYTDEVKLIPIAETILDLTKFIPEA